MAKKVVAIDAERSRPKRLKGNLYTADCPTRVVLDDLTSRWGTLVMVLLMKRTYRFSELAREIGGVSEKMLAQNLQALERDGFVLRTVYPTIPPKVEYSLTRFGLEAGKRIEVLTSWVEANVAQVMRARDQHAAGKQRISALRK